jgi:hypothetical protein
MQLSLRGEGAWRGRTTQNVNDVGQRRFLRLENCYVSSDGSELRHAFGLRTLLDLSEANDAGYSRYTIDALKPIFSTTPDEAYQYRYRFDTAVTLTLQSRAKPTHIHGFVQIADELLLYGESRFRENPIFDVAGEKLTIASVTTSGGAFSLTLSGTPAARSASDPPGLNGFRSDNIVYIEGVTVADPATQAILDARLNRRVHAINGAGTSGTTVVLTTTSGALAGSHAASAGEIHVTRNNRSNTNYSPDGLSPYTDEPLDRIDDPDALTCWRVVDRIDKSNVDRECFPAWVANRQRDFGDERSAGIGEGRLFTASPLCSRGQSRRFQRSLPYRVQPEAAVNRVILAAPGYGCLFQIPVKVTDDPLNLIAESESINIVKRNDEHYKPRALGIPKAVMLECVNKAPPTSSLQDLTSGFDFMVGIEVADPSLGFTAGEWQVAIAYEDDALGEEGLASDPVTVTIPSVPGRAFTIRIWPLHPGYLMGETLANKVNVYLAPPGAVTLSYYTSLHLERRPRSFSDVNGTSYDKSAVFGLPPGDGSVSATTAQLIYVRRIDLPMPADGSTVEEALDPNRAAPLSPAMPRGAQAARYIRGVLLAGGHVGNQGKNLELWEAAASHQYDGPGTGNSFDQPDEIKIRERGASMLFPDANTDGDLETSTLGIAGRNFPSAYQGIDLVQRGLLPSGSEYHTVDRVTNRRVPLFNSAHIFQERLRLTRDVVSRNVDYGTTPSTAPALKVNQPIWYLLPKDQLEVGDPGAPFRLTKTNIKFTDPNRGDTVTAIGHVQGFGIICSRKETHSFAWNRNPGAEDARILSAEFGCIASNSMVEFDGGLAWISERGPVAYGGAGLQFVGEAIAEDFYGSERRYECDSRGMMRHCWGAHDASRGIVLWGLVTRDATHEIEHQFESVNWSEASDEQKSRFPCNEVVIWNYRANAFSTWRPPTGYEILWVSQVRDGSGEVHMGALCSDKRIYALTDSGQLVNDEPIEVTLVTAGNSATTIGWTGSPTTGTGVAARNGGGFLATGMSVHLLNAQGEIVQETTIAALLATGATTSLQTAAALTWMPGYKLRVGAKAPMTIVSTFRGGEKPEHVQVKGARIRYSLYGDGSANAKVTAVRATRTLNGPTASPVAITDPLRWKCLGFSEAGDNEPRSDLSVIGQTAMCHEGSTEAPEVSVRIEVAGSAQTRIADILLEMQ